MYLNRISDKCGLFSLTYDVSENGADFVISSMAKKISIEVGYGNKGIRQAQSTLERIKGNYGLVISNTDLGIEGKIVKVPLKYFLLM